ncbi:MAG: hypothetical protein EXS31_18225 [Pedosphaera sp.]|nr:hypothetical protein [Pedosphaera sp.]
MRQKNLPGGTDLERRRSSRLGWSAVQALGRIMGCLLIGVAIGVEGAAPPACSATLTTPIADISVSFPQTFNWTLAGCAGAQIAFATTGVLPDEAYVPDPIGTSLTVSESEWATIRDTLDPGHSIEVFYWTVVDADPQTFLELALWRPFYIVSQIPDIKPSPLSGSSAVIGQSFSLHLDVQYDVLSDGVLQVDVHDADNSTKVQNWVAISQPGRATRGFDINFTRNAVGSRAYTVTALFRPNVATGPLTGVNQDDLVMTAPSYAVNWNAPSDTSNPTMTISTPTSNPTLSTTTGSINLTGTSSDDVGVVQVLWSNDRGGSGSASGTTSWAINTLALQPGINVLTVTARDAVGNLGSHILTVTYNVPDTTKPSISILSPTTLGTFAAGTPLIDLAGTASDDVSVTQVTWSNDRGGSGVANGTINWSVNNLPLLAGLNNITVTAKDTTGNQTAASLAITYAAPDGSAPVVTITSPSSSGSYTASNFFIDLAGTASDNVGVTQVTWASSRGGGGVAQGTTSWSIAAVQLQSGVNSITVTVRDALGNGGTKTLVVIFFPTDISAPNLIVNEVDQTLSLTTTISPIKLSGTASDNVGVESVFWSNDRGGGGDATGVNIWKLNSVPLFRGLNRITVTAQDSTGNRFRQTVRVTYNPPDLLPPTITVDSPTTDADYTSSSSKITISGVSADDLDVIKIAWSNDRGGAGDATGTLNWTAVDLPLKLGPNVIKFTATDGFKKTTSTTLNVFYRPVDTVLPSLNIAVPTTASAFTTDLPAITASGNASDNFEVTSVAWRNSRGGSGFALGASDWSVSEIALERGLNVLSFTATDFAGLTTSKSLDVTYSPPDHVGPAITPVSPTGGLDFTSSQRQITLRGTATDDNQVSRIAWLNKRGGRGTAKGTTSWVIEGVLLYTGENPITLIGTDDRGNNSLLELVYTYDPEAPAPPKPPVDPPQTPVDPPKPPTPAVPPSSQIVVQHTDGSVALWAMEGTSIRKATVPFTAPTGWQVVALADFNGDKKDDIVLRHNDGSVAFWLLDGETIAQSVVPFQLPAGWRIRATGDFDQDGQQDLVLQNTDNSVAFWFMNGTSIKKAEVPLKVPPGWIIRAGGDFNKDGHADLVLESDDRTIAFWLMNGTAVVKGLTPLALPKEWHISGAGRFTNSGSTDLILQHEEGGVAFWLLEGTALHRAEAPYTLPAGWSIVAPR